MKKYGRTDWEEYGRDEKSWTKKEEMNKAGRKRQG